MDLNTIIAEAKDLPTTPRILPKLQAVLKDENSCMDDIIEVVKVDAPLTAQILRISNSALFGGVSPSQNLNEAVSRLGYQEIYKVVGAAVAKQSLSGSLDVYNLASGELWERSITSAVLMEATARALRIDTDMAYTAGLLHSIGKLVVNNYYLKSGIELVKQEDEEKSFFGPDRERQLFGFDHAEVGAALLQNWEFTESIYSPIQVHLEPLIAPEHKSLACMIHLAAWSSPWLKADTDLAIRDFTSKEDVIGALGLSENDFRDILTETQESLEEVKNSLKA